MNSPHRPIDLLRRQDTSSTISQTSCTSPTSTSTQAHRFYGDTPRHGPSCPSWLPRCAFCHPHAPPSRSRNSLYLSCCLVTSLISFTPLQIPHLRNSTPMPWPTRQPEPGCLLFPLYLQSWKWRLHPTCCMSYVLINVWMTLCHVSPTSARKSHDGMGFSFMEESILMPGNCVITICWVNADYQCKGLDVLRARTERAFPEGTV